MSLSEVFPFSGHRDPSSQVPPSEKNQKRKRQTTPTHSEINGRNVNLPSNQKKSKGDKTSLQTIIRQTTVSPNTSPFLNKQKITSISQTRKSDQKRPLRTSIPVASPSQPNPNQRQTKFDLFENALNNLVSEQGERGWSLCNPVTAPKDQDVRSACFSFGRALQKEQTEKSPVSSDWWNFIPDAKKSVKNDPDIYSTFFLEQSPLELGYGKKKDSRGNLTKLLQVLQVLQRQYAVDQHKCDHISKIATKTKDLSLAQAMVSSIILRVAFNNFTTSMKTEELRGVKKEDAPSFDVRYESLGGRESTSGCAITNFKKAKKKLIDLIANDKNNRTSITNQNIIELHRILLEHEIGDLIERGKIEWPSCYTKVELAAGGNDAESYIPPQGIHGAMNEYMDWLENGINGIKSLEQSKQYDRLSETYIKVFAILAYSYFVSIHPFYNGNGRTAQLIMDYITGIFNVSNIALPKGVAAAVFVDNKIDEMLEIGEKTLKFLIRKTL